MALITITIALSLRLTPLYITQMPYDCDSWYIHYDINKLREDPTRHLLSDPVYDGYNNYWPGSIITPYTITLVTGRETLQATHLIGPALDGLATIPLYALAQKLNKKQAWTAALIVASAPSMIGIGLGLVKETIARPLLYTTLLAATNNQAPLLIPLSLGLAITHHLTSTIATTILAITPIMAWLLQTSTGTKIEKTSWKPAVILAIATIAWLTLAPPSNWRTIFKLIDPIQLTLYIMALITLAPLATTLIGEKPGFKSTWLPTITLYTILAITAYKGLSPGIQEQGPTLALYLTPAALLAPLIARAHANLRHKPWQKQNPLPYAYSYTLAGITAYLALAGTPLGQSPIGRVGNLLIPGLALLYLYSNTRTLNPKAVAVAIAGILYIQLLLTGHDPIAYDLPYHNYEQQTIQYLKQNNITKITGDAKIRDLAYYYQVKTILPIVKNKQNLIVIYRENLRYGYKLNSNIHTNNIKQIKQTLYKEDIIYTTGKTWILQYSN